MESSQPATATLEHLEGKDSGLFRLLKAESESLKEMAKRTQVKGLKESVDQVISIIGSIERNNAEMRAARSQVVGGKLMVVDAKKVVTILTQNLSAVVKESNKIVLDAISSVGTRSSGENEASDCDRPGGTDSAEVKAAVANLQTLLEAQSAKMDEMAERGKQTAWTDVVRSKGKKDKGDKADVKPTEQASSHRRGARPPAILVRVKDGSYSEALKTIKSSGDVQAVSDDIVGLSKTRDGDLLIRLKAKNQTSGKIVDAIGTAMGDKAAARELVHFQKVVVQDLDEQAEPSEIVEAICGATNAESEEVRVISTRDLSRGQKWVIISLPAHIASKALAVGRLRVGYVNCRLRLWEDRGRGRCPRCLTRGHTRDACKGTDRTECCRECGESGHQAANCTAAVDKKDAFARILQEESRNEIRENKAAQLANTDATQ